jgi:hypothetical protein
MRWRSATSVVALIIVANHGGAQAADRFSHRGRAQDASTRKPLGDVTASAYDEEDPADSSPCPRGKKLLDDDVSKADGSFVLRIPKGNSSYVVTYCATSYDVFTNPANDNVTDGSDVDPVPVKLFPVGGGGDAMRASLENLRADTRQETLAVLESSDAASFTASVQSLPAAEQALVRAWTSPSSATPEHPQVPPTEDRTPPRSLRRITASLRTTLAYFATASPDHFRTEVQRFDDISSYVRAAGIRPTPKVPVKLVLPPALGRPSLGGSSYTAVPASPTCEREEVLRALTYLYYSSSGCDGVGRVESETIDRAALLTLLRDPYMLPTHVFYPENKTTLGSAFDWNTSKRSQLESFKLPTDTERMLFIVSADAAMPSMRKTVDARMRELETYLRNDLRVPCRSIHVAVVEPSILRLTDSDAALLSIEPRDYRGGSGIARRTEEVEAQLSEKATLNEAVHVLSVPCSPEALFKEHRVLIWAHHRASMTRTEGEQSKHQRISRALFNADTEEHRARFLKELCSYCSALGPKPVGSPTDATREEACRLARDLWEEKQTCDDVGVILRR